MSHRCLHGLCYVTCIPMEVVSVKVRVGTCRVRQVTHTHASAHCMLRECVIIFVRTFHTAYTCQPAMPKGYDKKDAAKDTGSSISEVSRAWHDAREHAQAAGELPERAASKAAQQERSNAATTGTKGQESGSREVTSKVHRNKTRQI
jgi:hypothetical protein